MIEPNALTEIRSKMERINSKLESLEDVILKLSKSYTYLKSHWMDNIEVCNILNIKERTLLRYVKEGKLSKSYFGGRTYFKSDEILSILEQNYEKVAVEINNDEIQ